MNWPAIDPVSASSTVDDDRDDQRCVLEPPSRRTQGREDPRAAGALQALHALDGEHDAVEDGQAGGAGDGKVGRLGTGLRRVARFGIAQVEDPRLAPHGRKYSERPVGAAVPTSGSGAGAAAARR